MSVADEAKAAAEAEYPNRDLVLIRNGAGDPMAAITSGDHVMQRVPFAHGYQRGYEAGLAAAAERAAEPVRAGWVCTKCARAAVLGRDDDQIPEHHRTCRLRVRPKHGELGHVPSYDCMDCNA